MDLLTITCDRDFNVMESHAKSIQRFLAPCKHWVFVNQSDKPRQEWIDMLTPFYTLHDLEIIFTDDVETFSDINGWVVQQIWKIRAVDWIKKDYVVFDSKNIFVRDTDISTWTHEGPGVFGYLPDEMQNPDDPNYDMTINYILSARDCYVKYYNLPAIKKTMNIITPFVVRANVMSELSDMIKKDNVFANVPIDDKVLWHGDFLLYSMVAEKYGLLDTEPDFHYPDDVTSKSVFYHHSGWEQSAFKSGFDRLRENENYACISLHHTWIANASEKERIEMVEFLEHLDVLPIRLKKQILSI